MEHWYMKGKQKQAQGLIEILRERKREERMNSMLERVRTTQDAMERIHWEQKTGTYPEHRRREQEQRSGSGVKESMSGYEEPREGPKFLRCSISDVVNEIKSEKDLKQKNLEEKREMARRKKEERATWCAASDAAESVDATWVMNPNAHIFPTTAMSTAGAKL